MDWQTAYQLVLLDTHRSENAVDQTRAKVALARAVRRWAEVPFYFNEAYAYFRIRQGVQSYGLGPPSSLPKTGGTGGSTGAESPPGVVDPASLDSEVPYDMASPLMVYLQYTGGIWSPLEQVTHNRIREYTYSETSPGHPGMYSWFAEAMWFYPIPNQDYAVRLDYVQRSDFPSVIYESGAWRVVIRDPADPGSTIDVPNTWTCPLLDEAEDLVTAQARWEIYSHHHDDQENAVKEGELIETALQRLRRKTDARNSELRLVPTEV